MSQDYLKEFYEGHCDEDARLRSRHGMVEFLTTMRYIERYLKPGGKILEVGAGTGRYSHALARKGCWAPCTTCTRRRTSAKRSPRPSG